MQHIASIPTATEHLAHGHEAVLEAAYGLKACTDAFVFHRLGIAQHGVTGLGDCVHKLLKSLIIKTSPYHYSKGIPLAALQEGTAASDRFLTHLLMTLESSIALPPMWTFSVMPRRKSVASV